MNINIEIKAKTSDPRLVRDILLSDGARFVGTDLQEDTYFKVSDGRLKLREGNIENNLIFYKREDINGSKQSDFKLVKVEDAAGLKIVLTQSLGVLKTVKKSREIYYIDNVKFHIDSVAGLGDFIEIEAGNLLADKSVEELQLQCDFYMKKLRIEKADLLSGSYSDMMK